MKIAVLVLLMVAAYVPTLCQNVGVNTPTPDPSAVLDVQATNMVFLPPRLTTAQRDAIPSPAAGLIVFNTSTNCLNFYNGTRWVSTCVDAPPCVEPPAPAAGSNTPVCEGATLTLSASTVTGATYIWTGPDNFYSTTQNPSIPAATLAKAGTYTVRAWIAGCYSPEASTTVTVQPQQWTQLADFPGPNRDQAAIFAINDSLYVGTGNSSCPSNSRKDLWRYDIATNTWLQRADIPGTERYFMVGTALAGKGYLMGGTTAACNDEFTTVFEYTPGTNSWAAKTNPLFLGSKRATFALDTVAGLVYGGLGRRLSACEQFTDWYSYNPTTDVWTARAAFPGAKRASPVHFTIAGKLYVGMGYRWICNDATFSDFYMYDPGTNIWTARAAFPGTAGSQFAFFAIGNYGYVITFGTPVVYRYDPVANSWSTLPCNFPGSPTESSRTVALGGSAYVVSTTGSRDVWRFTP